MSIILIKLTKRTGKKFLRKIIDEFLRSHLKPTETELQDLHLTKFTNEATESLLVHLGKFVVSFLLDKKLFTLIEKHREQTQVDISAFINDVTFSILTKQYLLADLPMITKPRLWKRDDKGWTGGYLTYDIPFIIDKGDLHQVEVENVDYINFLQNQAFKVDYKYLSKIRKIKEEDANSEKKKSYQK